MKCLLLLALCIFLDFVSFFFYYSGGDSTSILFIFIRTSPRVASFNFTLNRSKCSLIFISGALSKGGLILKLWHSFKFSSSNSGLEIWETGCLRAFYFIWFIFAANNLYKTFYKPHRILVLLKYHTIKDLSFKFFIRRKLERIFYKLNSIVPSSYKDKSAVWSLGPTELLFISLITLCSMPDTLTSSTLEFNVQMEAINDRPSWLLKAKKLFLSSSWSCSRPTMWDS